MPDLHLPVKKVALVHDRLVSGIRDHLKERGFNKAVVGLSGGIDSALTCCLAKEALGSANVMGISLPSRYSDDKSEEYARALAGNLGVSFRTIPINGVYDAYIKALAKDLEIGSDEGVDVYLQNIQARIRGNILMAVSNRYGYFVLATGNKSEASVGYCTLYGDTVGGLAPLSDVFKTTVYQLADHINREGEVIPKGIIERAPSAELHPGQLDQDTLPPYDILDGVLCCIDKGDGEADLLKKGFDLDTVRWVLDSINKSGYKREQCPPGIKVMNGI